MSNSFNFKAWVQAARLRTLPLSVSGIIVGAAMADMDGYFRWDIFVLALLTTMAFQVLSNFANDYGDGVKGADSEERIGPKRAIQSGAISSSVMKKGVVITAIASLLLAMLLIYVSFGRDHVWYGALFLLLGLASVVAAIKYTVGGSAYGYHGLGDVFVFLFFGLVSVCGSYFLFAKHLSWAAFLPAVTVGLLSVAVLNLNNLRDIDSDLKAGKRTLAVLLGKNATRNYHFIIVSLAMITSTLFLVIEYQHIANALFLVSFVPVSMHLNRFLNVSTARALDPELKKVALSVFLFSILFYLGFNIFS